MNGNKINHQYLPSKFQTVLKQEKYILICCALHHFNYHIIFHENIKILDETTRNFFFFKHGRLKVGGATVFNDNLDVIEF